MISWSQQQEPLNWMEASVQMPDTIPLIVNTEVTLNIFL